MARRISRVFGVPPRDLTSQGVFNGFVDIDSKLYVDPHLLRHTKVAELKPAHDDYCAYFENVLKLLKAAQNEDDALFRRAVALLQFPEYPIVALGYAQGHTQGSGVGYTLAVQLARTAKQIVEAGVKDPTIFDLVGLIEENVGADRISDMATAIIMERLLTFSQRVADALTLPTSPFEHNGTSYRVPVDPKTGRGVLLLPADILRTLPVANDWSEIDIVLAHNEELRRKVNELIGTTWKEATRREKKRELRDLILKYPELLRDLIERYQSKTGKPYDVASDPEGLLVWHEAAQDYSARFPLSLVAVTSTNVGTVVAAICQRFGELIENNGLNQLFYSDSGDLRHERFAQLLFYGVADSYCEANNLDLSREANAGRGSVDFKLSAGYSSRVNVEVKYSSNSKLLHGFQTQLPIYNAAEKATESVYLVLRTKDSQKNIEALVAARNDALSKGLRVPELFVFDARLKSSASKP